MRRSLLALSTLGALAATPSLAAKSLPEDLRFVRIRIQADLPARFANSLDHQLSVCAGARCTPVFHFQSSLDEADAAGHFREVEYFSANRLKAAAESLGADASLAQLRLRLDSTLPGPSPLSASQQHAFAPGTERALRKQLATSLAAAAIEVPRLGAISLHSEITLLAADVQDITADFQRAPDPEGVDFYARLKKFRVVFVTGADGYKARYFGTEYFDSYMRWLDAHGVENQRVIPGTNRPIDEQAAEFGRLMDELANSPKPVILVNFSIANSNFAHYLLGHAGELASRHLVAGWIAANSSFLGNPLNEDYFNNPLERDITRLISPAQGLEDMRNVVRDAYVDANYDRILAAVRSIPSVITIDSRINDSEFPSTRQKRFLELDARGIDNDGSTGTFSHFIPGSESVSLDGSDHELLSKGPNAYGVDPYLIYRKLFARVLDRAERQP